MRRGVRIRKIGRGAAIDGPLCGTAAADLTERLRSVVGEVPGLEVVIDLSGLTALDTLGLRALLDAVPAPQKIVLEGLPLELEPTLWGMSLPGRISRSFRRSPPPPGHPERRAWPRFRCALELCFRVAAAPILCTGVATDISQGGVYVEFLQCDCEAESLRLEAVGCQASLRFARHFQRPEIPGRIVRAEERQAQLGLGFEFDHSERSVDEEIGRLVEAAR